jgi:hypothetical protein
MVYSLRGMKREMSGDEQKACKKGKIALKLVDLYFGKLKHSNLCITRTAVNCSTRRGRWC